MQQCSSSDTSSGFVAEGDLAIDDDTARTQPEMRMPKWQCIGGTKRSQRYPSGERLCSHPHWRKYWHLSCITVVI